MAKNTRLATTVTARYFPSAGAVDAFYLDGRMNGKREEHFADITLDREDRGSFYAVYASSHGTNMPVDGTDGNLDLLSKISKELKDNGRANIDSAINDLAETAVGVTGRLTLSDTATIQPYFAGVIVKDGEIAAVTLGRACAYLYRDDALFPLTQDDLGFEAIDYYGKSLPNIGDFSAGVAGTLRYSNIAQLKANDCIILCNKELMQVVGQKRMLQLLDQAEDQSDAAGMVMGLATHEDNQTSMQFMIGFVEDLIPLDRLGRSTLARGFAKLSRETGMNKTAPKLPRASGRTEFAQAANTEDLFANFAPGGSAAPYQAASKPSASVSAATTAAVAASQAAKYMRPENETPALKEAGAIPVSDLIADLASEDDEILKSAPAGVQDIVNNIAKSNGSTPYDNAGLSDSDREAIDAALEREGLYPQKGTDVGTAFEETEISAYSPGAQGVSPEIPAAGSELLEETHKRTKLPDARKYRAGVNGGEAEPDQNAIRKIAMFVLIGIAALILVFVIYTLAFGGGPEATTTISTSSTGPSVMTLPTSTKTPVIVPSSSATTAASGGEAKPGGEYEVKSGDTLYQIILGAYGVTSGEVYDIIPLVEEANPDLDADNLYVGQVIQLPAIGGETTAETTETVATEATTAG